MVVMESELVLRGDDRASREALVERRDDRLLQLQRSGTASIATSAALPSSGLRRA